MFCTNCGKKISEDSQFCSFCGEKINFHLTGDTHAVTAAHNLCASILDNSIFHSNPLNIDLKSILWKRVSDISDRSLRKIITGLAGEKSNHLNESGFDNTLIVASEKNLNETFPLYHQYAFPPAR